MKGYVRKDEVSEQQLEDLVRQHPGLIEEGLVYVDHQRPAAGGRLDIMLVDSDGAMVVAELKVEEDDGMLFQCLDYYDYVSVHVDSFARLYKHHPVDPTKPVRLLLIAPTFSQALVNRCRWLTIQPSLYTFQCLVFQGDDDITPVFSEVVLTSPPPPPDTPPPISEHVAHITDQQGRSRLERLLDEVGKWKPGSVAIDSIKYHISLKVNGRVFAYITPQRLKFYVETYTAEEKWTRYDVHSDEDLTKVMETMKVAMASKSG